MRWFIYQNSLVNGCRKDGSCWEYRYLIEHKGIWQDKVSWRNQTLQEPSAIYHKELVATLVMVTGCSITLFTPENKMSDRDVNTRLTQEETTGSLCIYWCVLCVIRLSESRCGQTGTPIVRSYGSIDVGYSKGQNAWHRLGPRIGDLVEFQGSLQQGQESGHLCHTACSMRFMFCMT